VHILAASFPKRAEDGLCRNVARLFTPGGTVGAQTKRIMTRFEREDWHISSGGPVRVFETALGRIGIAICYDVEFPLIARAQAEAGAEIILAPSCTDTESGYWRVRFGAQARALENQSYVVQAPTVGMASWSPAVDENRGRAGVYAPPDLGFPADGIVALGEMDRPQWLYVGVDLDLVAKVRGEGEVFNFSDWTEQNGAEVTPAELIDLR
jgi:predicted amidohydrolase